MFQLIPVSRSLLKLLATDLVDAHGFVGNANSVAILAVGPAGILPAEGGVTNDRARCPVAPQAGSPCYLRRRVDELGIQCLNSVAAETDAAIKV